MYCPPHCLECISTFAIVFGLMTERDTLRTSDQPPLLASELKEQG